MRQEQYVGLGQLVLADSPGNLFDPHAAVPAINPSHGVQEHHHEAPQRDKLKSPLPKVIVAGRRPVAARAHRLRAAAGPHGDLDGLAVGAMLRLLVDEAGKVLILVQQGDQPHGSATP